MADIFLSYAEEDRELARALVSLLEPIGWSVWWDRRIPAGKTWRKVLDTALVDMKCMLVLWSKHSVASEWVIEEAEEGKMLGKLVPLLIESVQPPRGFRSIQALDFVRWDGSAKSPIFQTLVQDIAAISGLTPSPIHTVAKGSHESALEQQALAIRQRLVRIRDTTLLPVVTGLKMRDEELWFLGEDIATYRRLLEKHPNSAHLSAVEEADRRLAHEHDLSSLAEFMDRFEVLSKPR